MSSASVDLSGYGAAIFVKRSSQPIPQNQRTSKSLREKETMSSIYDQTNVCCPDTRNKSDPFEQQLEACGVEKLPSRIEDIEMVNEEDLTRESTAYVNPLMMLSFIDRYLSVWIILSMVIGVLVGYYSPSAPSVLNSVQVLNVGLPVAFGLWFMMWPVLVKVRYEKMGEIFRMKGTMTQVRIVPICCINFRLPLVCLTLTTIDPDLCEYGS